MTVSLLVHPHDNVVGNKPPTIQQDRTKSGNRTEKIARINMFLQLHGVALNKRDDNSTMQPIIMALGFFSRLGVASLVSKQEHKPFPKLF
jgi:hypothetical protein